MKGSYQLQHIPLWLRKVNSFSVLFELYLKSTFQQFLPSSLIFHDNGKQSKTKRTVLQIFYFLTLSFQSWYLFLIGQFNLCTPFSIADSFGRVFNWNSLCNYFCYPFSVFLLICTDSAQSFSSRLFIRTLKVLYLLIWFSADYITNWPLLAVPLLKNNWD